MTGPVHDIRYVSGGSELLDEVEPLWDRLRAHHVTRSPHFSEALAGYSYADRKKRLLLVAAEGQLRVDLAMDEALGRYVGYCCASINGNRLGEIESIYVDRRYRRRRVGDTLISQALAWMDDQGVQTKVVYVVAGNEESHAFYARYGFYPYTTMLRQKTS